MSPFDFDPPTFDPPGGKSSPSDDSRIRYSRGHGIDPFKTDEMMGHGHSPPEPPDVPHPALLSSSFGPGIDLPQPDRNIRLTLRRDSYKPEGQPKQWHLEAQLVIDNSPVERKSLAQLVKVLFPDGFDDLEALGRGIARSSSSLTELIQLEFSLKAACAKLSDYLHVIHSYLGDEGETIGF